MTGWDIRRYRPQGYLFCATNEKHLAYLRANYQKQVAMGLKDVQLITADEIRAMFPQFAPTTSSAAVFARPMASSIPIAP